jgi:hypothetical protein
MRPAIQLFIICFVTMTAATVSAQGIPAEKKEQANCKEPVERLTSSKTWKTSGSKLIPLRTAVGDLTEDGKDETVVLVRDTEAGVRADEILVYENAGGEARLLTRFAVGKQGEYVLSIKGLGSNFRIDKGELMIDIAVSGKAGSFASTHFQTVTFRWDGKQMAETQRSEGRPLPEHMREKG